MADFMRPEARALLWRWREVLIACVICGLGLWWAMTGLGLITWLGSAVALAAFGFALAGVQRARFRATGKGPGVVQIVERKLGYFGPLTGGTMDLDDVVELALDPDAVPAPHWVLTGAERQVLAIPSNAKNAEALFDAFASLPGIRPQKLVDVLAHTPDRRVVIWRRHAPLLH